MTDETKTPPAGDDEATAFMPASEQPAPSGLTGGNFTNNFAPREVGQGIQVGDVLNHIFEVKRFIARGGMGEVFEGTNVNTEERVAIKVMLPSLAADANVIAMFRKEARTLTRLNHEGLVNYRVLAQEPQLGILYIVTEYIDGRNLADALGDLNPTPEQLKSMLRRLAGGMRAAHQLGAIHRDLSPDNVILEDGDINKGKVIDFGIAKDLDPGSATIIGDGFAGKLNYVAPEQLGDFGRDVGPWTDVYSLALVILAVAQGRNVQMGGSLVEAVDKRRQGPDLSAAPEEIRPVLAKMLKPNPAERLRSMDEVLAEIADKAPPGEAPPASKMPLFVGGGVAVVAAGVAAWFALSDHSGLPKEPTQRVKASIDSVLPQVSCSWLNVARVDKKDDGLVAVMTGVAGNPDAAKDEVTKALAPAKLKNVSVNFDEVAPITQSGCAALDTYRQIRVPDARHLSVPKRQFMMTMQPADAAYPNVMAANAVVTINVGDPKKDFALVGIEPSGKITSLIPDRAAFDKALEAQPKQIKALGGDKYQLGIDNDHTGWSGLMIVTGKGPFPAATVAPDTGSRGPDWRDKFTSAAANQGWQADMVWYKTVDGK